MKYKGYIITAEVETYERWSLDATGEADERIDSGDFFEITGYHFDNDDSGDSFFETVGASDVETLRELVDAHIAESAKAVV
jgi:hypothetical protein